MITPKPIDEFEQQAKDIMNRAWEEKPTANFAESFDFERCENFYAEALRKLGKERDECAKRYSESFSIYVDLRIERDELKQKLSIAREALEEIEPTLGDRLCAEGPLSKPYAYTVMKNVRDALKKIGEVE